jgi:deoxyribonuclease-4
VDRAQERGCGTFQIFSRNPRGWKFKDITAEESSNFVKKLNASGINPPIDHMPYLPNLASPKEAVYKLSIETLIEELRRCEILRIPYLVTHLGSHLGVGMEEGLKRIVIGINKAFSTVENDVMLLLEVTAGTKNSMGGTFEDIKRIINGVEAEKRIGTCFDTCHAFAAGYDLRTEEALDDTVRQFDETLGLEMLKVVHVNDCKGELGSHIDRHEHIGMGHIGEAGFRMILHHDAFKRLPIILETPIDSRRDDYGNIRKVRELAK